MDFLEQAARAEAEHLLILQVIAGVPRAFFHGPVQGEEGRRIDPVLHLGADFPACFGNGLLEERRQFIAAPSFTAHHPVQLLPQGLRVLQAAQPAQGGQDSFQVQFHPVGAIQKGMDPEQVLPNRRKGRQKDAVRLRLDRFLPEGVLFFQDASPVLVNLPLDGAGVALFPVRAEGDSGPGARIHFTQEGQPPRVLAARFRIKGHVLGQLPDVGQQVLHLAFLQFQFHFADRILALARQDATLVDGHFHDRVRRDLEQAYVPFDPYGKEFFHQGAAQEAFHIQRQSSAGEGGPIRTPALGRHRVLPARRKAASGLLRHFDGLFKGIPGLADAVGNAGLAEEQILRVIIGVDEFQCLVTAFADPFRHEGKFQEFLQLLLANEQLDFCFYVLFHVFFSFFQYQHARGMPKAAPSDRSDTARPASVPSPFPTRLKATAPGAIPSRVVTAKVRYGRAVHPAMKLITS